MAQEAFDLTLDMFQFAGWNVQWEKTKKEVAQQQKYLGFIVDHASMEYRAADKKMESIRRDIQEFLAAAADGGGRKTCRELAGVLGRVLSLHVSHGKVVQVATRKCQHSLGKQVEERGWDSIFQEQKGELKELAWVAANLQSFNGHPIRDEGTAAAVCRNTAVGNSEGPGMDGKDEDWDEVSYRLGHDGEWIQEQPWTLIGDQREGSAAWAELQQVQMALEQRLGGNAEKWSRLFWRTENRISRKLLRQGTLSSVYNDQVIRICWLEVKTKTKLLPVRGGARGATLKEATARLASTTSTDEWGVAREQLEEVFQEFELWPTVDAFASSVNAICGNFFSKWPQEGSAGVNFFSQKLSSAEVYFCCPPIKEIGQMIRKLLVEDRITAILVLPAWSGSTYWSLLREPDGYVKEVIQWKSWTAKCRDFGAGESMLGRQTGVRMWAAIFQTGDVVIYTREIVSKWLR
jgi:hypothetical protein